MEIDMALLSVNIDKEVFQPPKKLQRLESVVPAVPAKSAIAAKVPPSNCQMADWCPKLAET